MPGEIHNTPDQHGSGATDEIREILDDLFTPLGLPSTAITVNDVNFLYYGYTLNASKIRAMAKVDETYEVWLDAPSPHGDDTQITTQVIKVENRMSFYTRRKADG